MDRCSIERAAGPARGRAAFLVFAGLVVVAGGASAQTPPVFAPPQSFFAGDHPEQAALTDLNGDGKLDLVVAFAPVVGTLLGDGNGGFGMMTLKVVDNSYFAGPLLPGDLNGDGDVDLVACHGLSGTSCFRLFGNGTGTFAHAVAAIPTGGNGPHSGTLGDFDLNGTLDLVVASTGSGVLTFLAGNGLGGFGAPVGIPTVAAPGMVAAGRINGDGALDLIFTSPISSSLNVLLGNGGGAFAPAGSYSTGLSASNPLLADFDHDGNLDATSTWTTMGAFQFIGTQFGDGLGGLGAPVTFTSANVVALAAGDVNGDGDRDLLTTLQPPMNAIGIWLGHGNATPPVLSGTLTVFLSPTRAVVGDLDANGRLDVLTVQAMGFNAVVFGNITPLGAGLATYGTGSFGCNGAHGIAATATPTVGNGAFAVSVTQAPPGALGLLLVGNVAASGPDPFGFGFNMVVDPLASTFFQGFNVVSDASGYALAPVPIPASPALVGATVDAQAVFFWALACPLASPFNLSSSNGLQITVQP